MNKAYLLIGGNLGERQQNLRKARTLLGEKAGEIVQGSSLYETAAWGIREQASFLNQALLLHTELAPQDLLQVVLSIETLMGRVRQEKFGPRIIDIDILFYNHDVINEPGLMIPHPAMQERRFVLVPLDEIAADYLHPVLQLTVHQLLEQCTDPLEVEKIR